MAVPQAQLGVSAYQDEVYDRRPLWLRLLIHARNNPLGTVGLLLVVIMIFAAVFAPQIAPFDPAENNFAAMFSPPSFSVAEGATSAHILGTDEFV